MAIFTISKGLHIHVGEFFASKTVYHGPKTWPWWRLVSFSWIRCPEVQKPSTTHRFWVYFRWGRKPSNYPNEWNPFHKNHLSPWVCPAAAFDISIDRREWTWVSGTKN